MNFKNILSILLCFSVFSRGLFLKRGFMGLNYDIDLFAYPFFILLFIYIVLSRKLKLSFFLGYSLISLILIVPYIFSQLPLNGYFKIALPLIIAIPASYSFLYNHNLVFFFKNYVSVSKWVAIIGLIQFSLKLIGIKLFSNYEAIDLHSIVTEPSHYVVVILPACVYSYLKYKSMKIEFWIIFISLILTFKLTAFAGLFLLYVIIKGKFKYLILILPLSYIGFLYLLQFDAYNFRIFAVYDHLFNGGYASIIHGTPLSFVTNFEVAVDVANTHFFGGGIGSHPFSYDMYYRNHEWIGPDRQFGINKSNAHSLTIRIISEFGYLGILMFVSAFIFTFNKIKNDYNSKIFFMVILSHFIAKSIKLGGYIDFGTPIFISLFIILCSKSLNFNRKL